MQLNKFQETFKDLMLAHPDALDTPPQLLSDQLAEYNIALPTRLKVYRNNIIGSLTDVIVASFPILKTLVGQEFLEAMARSFILSNPPEKGCLNTFGRGFDDFIARFKPAQSLPYLPDVARLEIALNDSYYAIDETALTGQDLNRIAPEELGNTRLKLSEHIKLIRSDYPLIAIHDFCLSGNQDGNLDLNQGGVQLMVYRQNLETHMIVLEESEYAMLDLLSQKLALGTALETIVSQYESFDFQSFLQKHLTLETFAVL